MISGGHHVDFNVTEIASLKSLWKQWTVVVDLFARRDVARRQVKAEDYRALHARLLETCKGTTGAELADFAQRAAELAGPWMSVESLNEAPRKLLEDLQAACQQLAAGRSKGLGRGLASQPWFSVALFIVLFLGAGLGTLIALDPGQGTVLKSGVLNQLSQFEQTRKTSMRTDDGRPALWVLGVAGGTVTAVMAYYVFRAPKRT